MVSVTLPKVVSFEAPFSLVRPRFGVKISLGSRSRCFEGILVSFRGCLSLVRGYNLIECTELEGRRIMYRNSTHFPFSTGKKITIQTCLDIQFEELRAGVDVRTTSTAPLPTNMGVYLLDTRPQLADNITGTVSRVDSKQLLVALTDSLNTTYSHRGTKQ